MMTQYTSNVDLTYFTELMNKLLPVMYLIKAGYSNADHPIGLRCFG